MKIGVDLRVLQIGHQFRGIGEVTKRSLNEIFKLAVDDKDSVEFVFYQYEDKINPLEYLELPDNLEYEIVKLGVRPQPNVERSISDKITTKLNTLYWNPIKQSGKSDVFLQFDFALGVPKNTKTILIKHDIIPYIFWNDYFVSPLLHVKHKAARTALRTALHNYEYKRVLKRSVKNATKIICVSEHTKRDLHNYLKVPLNRMAVIYWGVSEEPLKLSQSVNLKTYPNKPYLLFVGAVDARRRAIDDLVAAFNNLKANGRDIQLVLAGENFQSPQKIPNDTVRRAVLSSSYTEDILTLGYIDDPTKQKLYKEALAFVFPTIYEGFGIPVLEAMLIGCPVIVYKNSSIPEVGGKYALYANSWEDIQSKVEYLLNLSQLEKEELIECAKSHAQHFNWSKTGRKLYKELKSA